MLFTACWSQVSCPIFQDLGLGPQVRARCSRNIRHLSTRMAIFQLPVSFRTNRLIFISHHPVSKRATDYARRYQWPNAFCPSPTTLCHTAMTAVPGAFALESVEDYGHREWLTLDPASE